MHFTHSISVFGLISLIITLPQFVSAESPSSSGHHIKNVTATDRLGNGEVATQPGHILAEKDSALFVPLPSDEDLHLSLEGFTMLLACRFKNDANECNADLATNSMMFAFSTYFRDVLDCRFEPGRGNCIGNDDIPDDIRTLSSYINVPTPLVIATATSTVSVCETGILTSFDGSISTSVAIATETLIPVGTVTVFTTLSGINGGSVTPEPTPGSVKRDVPIVKRADEMQQDMKSMLNEVNVQETGDIIVPTIEPFTIIRPASPNTNGSTTALATTPSTTHSPKSAATSVPLAKRLIPAGITQDPHTPSATAVPTSTVSSMDPSRKGAIGAALGAALPNIIANAAANGITTVVEDSMNEREGEKDNGGSEEAEEEENEDKKKRPIPMAVTMDPILGDDLLSGGLVPESNAVNGAVGGKLGEAWERDQNAGKGGSVPGNGQVGIGGMAGRRKRYNGVQATRTMN